VSEVPCNGCVRCCKKDLVRLLPQDDETQYKTEPHPLPGFEFERVLAHKPNGDCWYLGDSGCTIHETKPTMCRSMDCRNIAERFSWTQARKAGLLPVWNRGHELRRNAL
jgi:Fe-S-cluster containining protein